MQTHQKTLARRCQCINCPLLTPHRLQDVELCEWARAHAATAALLGGELSRKHAQCAVQAREPDVLQYRTVFGIKGSRIGRRVLVVRGLAVLVWLIPASHGQEISLQDLRHSSLLAFWAIQLAEVQCTT